MPDSLEPIRSLIARGHDAARQFCRIVADNEPVIFEGFFPREIARERNDHGRRCVGTFDECRSELDAWEAEGRSVYAHVNPGGTKKGEIASIRCVSVEFDAPGEGHARSQQVPSEWHIEPTAIVRRGASVQAHWRIKDCPVECFIELQRRLQRFYQSDARTIGEWRLWRVPGFRHPSHADHDVELVIGELADLNGPYAVKNIEHGIPELPPEEPREPSQPTGEPVSLADLRAMLSYIDPTFSGDDGAWIGIAKAIFYGDIPTNDPVDWESLCDDWSSGEIWRERTGDKHFFVSTYHDCDTMRARLADGPRSAGQKIGLGTIWKLARDGGYPYGAPKVSLMDRLEPSHSKDAGLDSITYFGDEIFRAIKPQRTIIDPWCPADGACFALAQRGLGKTTFFIDMALSIVLEEFWAGYPVEAGWCVIYVCAEDPISFRDKLLAACKQRDIDAPSADRWLTMNGGPQLTDDEEVERWKQHLSRIATEKFGRRPCIVFFDTLQKVTLGTNQADEENMPRAIRNGERIAAAVGGPAWFAAHPPKNAKDDDLTVHGSGLIENASKAILTLTKVATGLKLVLSRAKYARDDGHFYLLFKMIEAETGELKKSGRPMTASYLEKIGGCDYGEDGDASASLTAAEIAERRAYALAVKDAMGDDAAKPRQVSSWSLSVTAGAIADRRYAVDGFNIVIPKTQTARLKLSKHFSGRPFLYYNGDEGVAGHRLRLAAGSNGHAAIFRIEPATDTSNVPSG